MLFKNISIIDEEYKLRKNKYVIVEDDLIVAIGDAVPIEYEGEIYDGKNKILVPGFYNAHCHVPMVLMRGHGEGLSLQNWLTEKIFPFEALMTKKDIYYGSLLGIAEMIASGCISFTDMYFQQSGICTAVEESGIKANLCYGYVSAANSPSTMSEATAGNLDTQTVLDYAKKTDGRIKADIGIHAEYTSNTPIVSDIVDYARENNLRIHLHLSETAKEHEEAKQRRGMTPAAYFESLGVFALPTTAAHCVWIEGEDYNILARNNVTVAHCPSSNLKLGSGIADIRRMQETGINVAIGTDGAASNNNLNMLEEINLVGMVQKGYNRDPLFLSNQELLAMACKNGAMAQGRGKGGSIKVGNKADVVVYSTDSPHMQPVIDGASNILYSAQSSDVILTMIDGRVVYKNGEYKTIDIEKVKAEVAVRTKEKLKLL